MHMHKNRTVLTIVANCVDSWPAVYGRCYILLACCKWVHTPALLVTYMSEICPSKDTVVFLIYMLNFCMWIESRSTDFTYYLWSFWYTASCHDIRQQIFAHMHLSVASFTAFLACSMKFAYYKRRTLCKQQQIYLLIIWNMICYNIISEFYLHAIPSYAWNDKHCYGGKNTNDYRQNKNHINDQHSAMRVLFPTSTLRKTDWSISHHTTWEIFLTLKCAAIDRLRHTSCW